MEIVNFLRDYWSYIATAILLLLQVVLIIIKRRPKSYDEFVLLVQDVLSKIPMFICEAEQLPHASGFDKKDYVLAWAYEYVKYKVPGQKINEYQYKYFYKTLSDYIEKVLSTPTKKGGLGRDEEIE